MKTLIIEREKKQSEFGTCTGNNLPNGWYWEETPGHGYLHLPREDNDKIPDYARMHRYEEDCAFNIPLYFHGDKFTKETQEQAIQGMMDWYPEIYERYNELVLLKGESSQKDRNYYSVIENMGKWGKSAGYGDWCFGVPVGKVYATLRKVVPQDVTYEIKNSEGEEIGVLMDSKVYRNKEYFEDSDFQIYHRDETYYTWEEYTKKTGRERYV